MMGVHLTGRTDNGDGTEIVYARTDAGQYVHVHLGHHLYGSELMWHMLTLAGTKADSKAAALTKLESAIEGSTTVDNKGM